MTSALFGQSKFGTFKFGATSFQWPKVALEIDWDMDGAFDGSNDGFLLTDLQIERGRRYTIRADGNGFEPEDTGRFSATLVDVANRYNPYNVNSPLYPNVGPGKMFRVLIRTPNSTYALMHGILSDPIPAPSGNISRIHLEGRDGWQLLRDDKARISIPLQQGIYADEAIRMIVKETGWIGSVDLDGGASNLQYWWLEDQSASTGIFDLVQSELGRLWVAADGTLTFRSRHYVETTVATITEADIYYDSLRIMQPWEVVRNSVRVVAKPRTVQASSVIWKLSEALRVRAGETVENVFFDYTYNGERVPATNVLQPVPTTDFLANSLQNGLGVDLTASFIVSVTIFSTGGQLSITNNSASDGWLTFAQVTGDAIVVEDTVPIREDNLPSQAQMKQVRTFELSTEWMQNPNAARSAAKYLATYLGTPRKFLQLDLLPNPDLQFALDLGNQVHVYLPSDGIDNLYRVHYISHRSMNSGLMTFRTTLMLEPYEQMVGDYWIVPSQIPMQVAY